MIISQTLDGSIDELIAAANKLRTHFPNITSEKAIEVALELKRMGQAREISQYSAGLILSKSQEADNQSKCEG